MEEQTEIFQMGITAAATPSTDYTATPPKKAGTRKWKERAEVEDLYFGESNDLPNTLIKLIEQSSIMGGIIEFWEGVLFGDGISIYERTEEGIKETIDKEVLTWVETSGVIWAMLDSLPDFLSTGNLFVQYIFNQGSETTKKGSFISKVHHSEVIECRLARDVKTRRQLYCVISSEFAQNEFEAVNQVHEDEVVLPVFSEDKQTHEAIEVLHIKRKKAGRKYYGLPVWWSKETELILNTSLEMYKHQNAEIKHILGAKYKIMLYKDYFKAIYPEPEYDEAHRQKEKEKLVQSVHENLTNPSNAGKSIWCDFYYDEKGNIKAGIIIDKIEQHNNTDAYMKSREQTTAVLAMATNTNPGLADLIISGKMGSDTGSAVRESYNVLSKTKTKINRMLILEIINKALRFNFPDKNVFADFKTFELVTADVNKTGVEEETKPQTEEEEATE